MTLFNLPDLGEGLLEAEIVEWHVKSGDSIAKDDPLVSVETAKAIVEIPSPHKGKIHRLFGSNGDIVQTGDPLVEFLLENEKPTPSIINTDKGTVVGEVKTGNEVVHERATTIGNIGLGVKATPAVRALAQRLDVDLSIVTPSGPDGVITAADVQRVSKILAEVGPMQSLRGVRRAMARSMTQAHAEVVAVTVTDDADIDRWHKTENITLRLIRAIIAGCKTEPSLNAWYDTHAVARRVLEKIHLGIAVDTEEGLFVPVLRDITNQVTDDLRKALEAIKEGVRTRRIPAEQLRGHTFTLSNFGTFAGRYADLVVVPPTVAILGAGRVRDSVVATEGGPSIHRLLPLSLSFDHRAVTGGEATRFLAAVIADLEQPNTLST
jgi:pyruvate dehydrogenase E2 component (dihydrolipoamide acetyltransferase)